jgi:hypothetical protein
MTNGIWRNQMELVTLELTRNLTTGPSRGCSQPAMRSSSLTVECQKVGTLIKVVHRSYDLSKMFPLCSPGKAGSLGVQDLSEIPVEREGKGSLKEGATRGLGDQGRGELLEDRVEVSPSKA